MKRWMCLWLVMIPFVGFGQNEKNCGYSKWEVDTIGLIGNKPLVSHKRFKEEHLVYEYSMYFSIDTTRRSKNNFFGESKRKENIKITEIRHGLTKTYNPNGDVHIVKFEHGDRGEEFFLSHTNETISQREFYNNFPNYYNEGHNLIHNYNNLTFIFCKPKNKPAKGKKP